MKSNSIIAKNLFYHLLSSVLSPFTATIVPTNESKWKQTMMFATSSYSMFSPAEFKHPTSQVDWEFFLLCCHCCSFVLILWLASASVHLLSTGEPCSWLPPPILVWGNTITDSSGLLALYFLFHIQFSQFSWGWSFWFHVLCFLNGKVLQLFFCFRQKHFGFTQKILHSFSLSPPEVQVWNRQEGFSLAWCLK